MKKPLLKRFDVTTGLSILLLTIAFIINGCRKETKIDAQQPASVEAATHFSIIDAKDWFSGNKTTLANKIKLNSKTSFLSEMANFTPLWDSARTAIDTNFYVVEAPAKYVKAFGFATDETQQNINGITRLLVLKSKRTGDLSAALMHIHGDQRVKIADVHYMSIPQSFSGNIFYTTLQGIFINGNVYKDGKIIKTSNKEIKQGTKPDGPQVLTVEQGSCEIVTIDYYTQFCYVEHTGEVERCTDWYYSYSVEIEYCTPPGTSPPTGGVDDPVQCPPTPPGGGGGGGTPPGGPITVESINGRKSIRLEQGGSSNCVIDPPPADTINLLPSGCNRAVVKKLLDKSLSGQISGLIQSVFNSTDKVNLKFIESTNTNGYPAKSSKYREDNLNGVKSFTYEVALNPNLIPSDASQEYKAAIIIHEILHSYLSAENPSYNTQLQQHAVIATQYADGVRDILYQLFGTNDEQGYSLAFGGLADLQRNNSTAYENILAEKHLTESERSSNYEYQRAGLAGTPCP